MRVPTLGAPPYAGGASQDALLSQSHVLGVSSACAFRRVKRAPRTLSVLPSTLSCWPSGRSTRYSFSSRRRNAAACSAVRLAAFASAAGRNPGSDGFSIIDFSRGIQKAFAEIPYVLPHLFFPNKLFLSFDTVKTTLRDSVIVACTIVAMVFAARLWDLLVATLLNYGMSALVGRPPL